MTDITNDLLFQLIGKPARRKKVSLRERDTQRSRVYASDRALMAVCKPMPSMEDIAEFVSAVWWSDAVSEAYPNLGNLPRVLDGRARRRAGANSTMITMPKATRNEAIVLHELAHVINQRINGMKVAGHGWQFCQIYLKLVRHILGDEKHAVLKDAFKRYRVRFT